MNCPLTLHWLRCGLFNSETSDEHIITMEKVRHHQDGAILVTNSPGMCVFTLSTHIFTLH